MKKWTARVLASGLVLALLAGGAAWFGTPWDRARGAFASGESEASGPMAHQAFVWQRQWTEGVEEAVRGAPDLGLTGVVALGAEIEFDGEPRVIFPPVDIDALAAAGPVSLALRIADDPDSDEHLRGPVARLAADVGEGLVTRARAGGVPVAELQLDHDCPTRRLPVCAELLALLRQRVAPVPVVFTALPTWLDSPSGFEAMLAAAHGYVLQVHGLESGRDREPILVDPAAARRAVVRAASFGRPFRVALPTHAYVVTSDAGGRLLDVSSEETLSAIAPTSPLRRSLVASKPAAMAALVAEWTRSRPAELRGVLWFRLPVPGDRFNWTAASLARAVSGRVADRRLELATRVPRDGLVELDLLNLGDTAEPPPDRVELRWRGAPPLAFDALTGYRLEIERSGGERTKRRAWLIRDPSAVPTPQRPGERRVLAWMRFEEPQTEIGGHLVP